MDAEGASAGLFDELDDKECNLKSDISISSSFTFMIIYSKPKSTLKRLLTRNNNLFLK